MSLSKQSSSDISQLATSQSLLLQVKSQDAAAWQRLVKIYTPLVHYWCRRSGLANEDVHDVGQETFASVWRGLPTFDHSGAGQSFRGWLRTIVRCRLIDLHRIRQQATRASGGTEALQRLDQLPDPLESPDEWQSSFETGLVFRAALEIIDGEFEPTTSQAFWLTTIEERPPDQVASLLNISINAVYKAKSRVLRRLREMLDGFE